MKNLKLDVIDLRILNAIQSHGQLSKFSLSEIVNISPTSCLNRVTRLKEAGYIRGYYADINVSKVADFTKVVVTVSLKRHHKSDFDVFESYINHIEEIIHCVATGGGFDYVMTVVTANLASFQQIMDQLTEAEIGIDRYITYFVTRDVKSTHLNLLKTLS